MHRSYPFIEQVSSPAATVSHTWESGYKQSLQRHWSDRNVLFLSLQSNKKHILNYAGSICSTHRRVRLSLRCKGAEGEAQSCDIRQVSNRTATQADDFNYVRQNYIQKLCPKNNLPFAHQGGNPFPFLLMPDAFFMHLQWAYVAWTMKPSVLEESVPLFALTQCGWPKNLSPQPGQVSGGAELLSLPPPSFKLQGAVLKWSSVPFPRACGVSEWRGVTLYVNSRVCHYHQVGTAWAHTLETQGPILATCVILERQLRNERGEYFYLCAYKPFFLLGVLLLLLQQNALFLFFSAASGDIKWLKVKRERVYFKECHYYHLSLSNCTFFTPSSK